jgi:glycosyltransferase involved in cell wall biosynthesis
LQLKTWKCRISVVSLWDVASNLDLQVGNDKNNHQSVLDTFQSLEPLLILISTIEPRKGHIELIDASKYAWNAGARFNLVLIGQLGWVDAPTLNKFQNFLKEFESRAIWIETADDEFLARTLKSADLLVSPSLGEGFGLPVAEALKFCIPVLANAIPAYKEIFGNQAVFYGIDEEYSTLTSALCDIEGVIQNAENIVKTLPSDRPNTIDQLMRAFKEV